MTLKDELRKYGPDASAAIRVTPSAARAYCRRLARTHYENFTVASWLLPRRLRQHFCNVYAYCRWADDLADEVGDPETSSRLLSWWRRELAECYRGRAWHPVFVALRETIAQFQIPPSHFVDLLDAFEQDQRQLRYETADELLDYCRRSANPVGRIVLHLAGATTAGCTELSDSICTGLQLANFCQDVARDWERGRIYLPRTSCRAGAYDESDFAARRCNAAFRSVLRGEVDWAESHLRRGWPLVAQLPPGIRIPVDLFVRGGLAILDAIRRQDYDVWRSRPAVSRWRKIELLLAACVARWKWPTRGRKSSAVPVPPPEPGRYDEGHEHGS